MSRLKRWRDYKVPQASNPHDPKWAGRYISQNFSTSSAIRAGIDLQALITLTETLMVSRKCDARTAFLSVLDNILGVIQPLKMQAKFDHDATNYDESAYEPPKTITEIICVRQIPGSDGVNACYKDAQGRSVHHTNCPVELTEAEAAEFDTCSNCPANATANCERCDMVCCDDCFVQYHNKGKRHDQQ